MQRKRDNLDSRKAILNWCQSRSVIRNDADLERLHHLGIERFALDADPAAPSVSIAVRLAYSACVSTPTS